MQKLCLLDAYALIYRSYYALIRSPRINSKGENTSAIFGFVNTLEDVLKKENPDFIGIAFDPKGKTFRHETYPEYKAQRESTPEDIRFAVPIIKDIIRAYNIPILEVERYEADDVIGTIAKKAASSGLFVEMITPDKDYGQLVEENIIMLRPGHGANPMERMGEKEVCEKYGLQKTSQIIDYLGLMGDASDNVPGCPGVGAKTAAKLIEQFGDIGHLLERTDELKGALKTKVEENKEKILFSKFLVTIKTDVPIELNLDELKRKEPDKESLKKIFERLEFRSFISKMFKPETIQGELFQNPTKPQYIQGDLFGNPINSVANETNSSEVLFDAGKEIVVAENLTDLKNTKHEYHLIDNEEECLQLCQKLLTNKILSFDTETTSTDAISARLVGFSFSVRPFEAYYISVPQDFEEAKKIVGIFKPLYESEEILKVGQNIKYDIIVLKHYGINVRGSLFDTMLAHYVVQPELRHNMDYLAEIYLHYRTIHIDELIGPAGKKQKNMSELKPEEVYEYACEDADVTLRLVEPLKKEMDRVGATKIFYELEMPLVPVLAKMEMDGVVLDTKAINETGNLFRERMKNLERDIYTMAGHEFLLTSPRQVGEVLFGEMKLSEKAKKTKSGQYQTSEAVLEGLKSKHPIVEKILAHRGLKKLISTYIDALPKLINPETGHLHTSFNQAVTATGRLSSSNPNLQNIPVRGDDGKEIRKAFVPEFGCVFFSADYSQIELRIMAHLSGDKNMTEAFCHGEDIHAATAAKIYKKALSEISIDERRKAKTANFGIIYGISAFGLAERMEVSRTEARELIDNYFATFPAVSSFIETCKEKARRQGYIETVFGRRRYLPDINSGNAVVRGYAERNAVNAPIQGTAADIIKLAMIRIAQRFEKEHIRSKMILQVHDELNFSVYPEELDQVRSIVIGEMENAYKMTVPLIADCGVGQNWLEAH